MVRLLLPRANPLSAPRTNNVTGVLIIRTLHRALAGGALRTVVVKLGFLKLQIVHCFVLPIRSLTVAVRCCYFTASVVPAGLFTAPTEIVTGTAAPDPALAGTTAFTSNTPHTN